MKKHTFVIASFFLLSLILTAQVAQAQQALIVNIPFEFVAGSVTLSPGEYRIQNPLRNSAIVLIQSSDSAASAMVVTMAKQANELQTDSKLVFNRYGDRYFLSQIWTAGASRGRELSKTAREKELLLSARIDTKDQVTLVARLSTTRP